MRTVRILVYDSVRDLARDQVMSQIHGQDTTVFWQIQTVRSKLIRDQVEEHVLRIMAR